MPNLKPRIRRQQLVVPKPLSDHEQYLAMWKQVQHGLDPVRFAREELEFFPDDKQQMALLSRKKRIVLLWARQRGKSDVVALRALHRALFWAKSMIIIVSASEAQALEVMRKVNAHRRKMKVVGKPLEENKQSLEFQNRSRIIALPASAGTIRGYSAVDLLIEDEAGEVPDELHETVKPMLQVSNGTMFLLGTPKGPKGHFAETWRNGDEASWEKIMSTAWDNPRVLKTQLEQERKHCERLGKALWFQQEYECAFIATGSGLVYPFKQSINSSERLPTHDGWQFALGIDYGYVDSTAFVVLGWKANDPVVYVIETHKQVKKTPGEVAVFTHMLTKKYPFARIVGDMGGLGKGYAEETRKRFRVPIEPADKNNKRGYIDLMAGDMRSGLIKVMPGNEDLLEEWNTLPWNEERSAPADDYEDHLSDAALYAWRSTYGYLEEARTLAPEPGSPEALKAEADAMFESRMRDVSSSGDGFWNETTMGDVWGLS